MNGQSTFAVINEPAAERLDRVVEVLLVALLAFMPTAFGVVHAWSEEIVIVMAAAISLVFLLKLVIVRSVSFVWSWAYVPVAVFILVAAFQLLPLPAPLVAMLSPNTVALKTNLLQDLPDAGDILSSMTLSFYPRATRHDLRLLLAVAAVFVVVVNVYRQPERIKRLLAAIAVIGAGIALVALAQDVAGNGRIYWLVPTYDQAHSGTFVNHSHYGQFMNLCIGAALGLLFVILHEAFAGRRITAGRVAEYLSSPAGKVVAMLLGVIVLGAATLFISLTRGGMISLLIAAVFTTLMLSWRRSLRGQGWVIVLLALGSLICVLYIGFDQVYDRLATLRDLNDYGGRWQIVRDISVAWAKFPVFGVGLGTHEVVYPMFDRSTIAQLALHAENEYAQAVEETGLVGLLALGSFGVFVWTRYGRSIANASIPICSAAYGLGFGLLAILIHSLSDFGQHLPANAMLSAVFCGLLIALEPAGAESLPEEGPRKRAVLGVWRPMALLLVVAMWVWGVSGANDARIAEASWNRALIAEHHLDARGWRAPRQAYEYLFAHAGAAAKAEPDNIHYRHWLAVYKWLSLTPYTDPNTGQLWPEAMPWARQVVQELHQARPLCPTFGPQYCVVGEIERSILRDSNGAERIRQGYRLAPCDATTCLAAARVDAEEGKTEEAFAKLSRAVQLNGTYFPRAVQLCVGVLERGDLALRLAGDDAGRLAYAGQQLALLAEGPEPSAGAVDQVPVPDDRRRLADEAKAMAFRQLRQQCTRPDAPASAHAALASLYRQSGDAELAIRHYRRAIRLDYDRVGWHFALAQSLAQIDRIDEAMHEARICLRLREDYAPARQLLEQLAVRSVTGKRPSLSAERSALSLGD
jgi:tetratricopeptide (TPR) repeat protein/O-antigen ligase